MSRFNNAMRLALQEARKFQGATAPNPPVGAVALGPDDQVLAVSAHERAGSLHAEAALFKLCAENGVLSQVRTLVVTLEPCNHFGKTPPCTQAILKLPGIKTIVIGSHDPNRKVAGGGIARLKDAGREVIVGVLKNETDALIRGFENWCRTERPWVTLKTAFRKDERGQSTMIPHEGTITFTSETSLRLSHELRRRADAILTGSGTVLSDLPEFTVRHVADHLNKRRWLVVLDRRRQIPTEWLQKASQRGFEVVTHLNSPEEALRFLGEKGAHEVLVEAGPTLSEHILTHGLWNEHVRIHQGEPDQVETVIKGAT